jgi:hypothetical protein
MLDGEADVDSAVLEVLLVLGLQRPLSIGRAGATVRHVRGGGFALGLGNARGAVPFLRCVDLRLVGGPLHRLLQFLETTDSLSKKGCRTRADGQVGKRPG